MSNMNYTNGGEYQPNGGTSQHITSKDGAENNNNSQYEIDLNGPGDSSTNTSTDSTDEEGNADAQLLSASILATIQTTPRTHTPPASHRTPSSKTHSSSLNGRSYPSTPGGTYDDEDHRHENGNGKHSAYPHSPTAEQTPRVRRSARVSKPAKPYTTNEKEKSREKEKASGNREKPNGGEKEFPSGKRSGASSGKPRKRFAAANDSVDTPHPVTVLGRTIELESLRRPGSANSNGDVDGELSAVDYADPNWAESVPMYSLVRAWMCSGVDTDPFHLLRPDSAESVLLDMHDYIAPPTLPPPSTSTATTLPERPKYPASTDFSASIQKGTSDSPPKALLQSYVSNCKTFRTWWKANYNQRLNRYKGRLAILFPDPHHAPT